MPSQPTQRQNDPPPSLKQCSLFKSKVKLSGLGLELRAEHLIQIYEALGPMLRERKEEEGKREEIISQVHLCPRKTEVLQVCVDAGREDINSKTGNANVA